MKNPPSIQDARIVGATGIEIRWSTGETLLVDLGGLMRPPFDALADEEFFARMRVSEWGDGLDWPGGLDIGADRLYELARQQAGLMTPDEFGAWMDRNKLSLTSAAQSLGMTRRMIAHYRTGSMPIPKVVGLACKGWDALAENTREHGGAIA